MPNCAHNRNFGPAGPVRTGQAALSVFLLQLIGLVVGLGLSPKALADFHAGPIFDSSPLAIDSGHRTEALGPLFYDQHKETETTWAMTPLLSWDADSGTESKRFDLLYPLLTYERFGMEYRWQLAQVFSFSGGRNPNESSVHRFTLFPIYFQQRSPDTNENYTAVMPFYGHLKNRLFRDDIFFVMFPLYVETRKRDVVTDNYLAPFFDVRHGDGLHGWQFWPIVGYEHKDVTTHTNGFGETVVIGGFTHWFALWPIHLHQDYGLGTENPEKFRADIPLYVWSRSPQRDYTSVLWPLFSWVDDRQKKYREWDGPYPLVAVARGEGKTTTRFLPFFSQARNDTIEDNSYLWPIYKYKRIHADPLDLRRTRILFFLFSDLTEKNTETGKERGRVDLWPLFVSHRDFNGDRRLQILALVEVALPNNGAVERNWSPLWSVWRSESSPKAGTASQSLLWNLYRRDSAPASKNCSLLFGIFQYQSDSQLKKLRLFYLPVYQWHVVAKPPAK